MLEARMYGGAREKSGLGLYIRSSKRRSFSRFLPLVSLYFSFCRKGRMALPFLSHSLNRILSPKALSSVFRLNSSLTLLFFFELPSLSVLLSSEAHSTIFFLFLENSLSSAVLPETENPHCYFYFQFFN